MTSIFSIGAKLDHFRDSYLSSFDTQLCSLVLTIKYPLGAIERKSTIFVKCTANKDVKMKKVLNNRPNLTLTKLSLNSDLCDLKSA